MKPFVLLICGVMLASCTPQAPTAKPQGQLLDDAALQQFRDDAPSAAAEPEKPVRSLKTVTLGKGEVDLSRWQSAEERANEGADGENAGADADAVASGGASEPVQTSDFPDENIGVTSPDSAASAASAPELPDNDEGGRVEADDVTFVPADE